MAKQSLRGVVAVVPIPFTTDQSIDEASLRKTADWLGGSGVGGMCLPAYGGEFYKLSEPERERVVRIAVEANHGRVPLLAQANHGSSFVAAEMARTYEKIGADIISFAIPRMFGTTEADILQFCRTILDAVSIPVLIQDFNPGGPTIGADFIEKLHTSHAHFKYVKLEEPMIIDKFNRIHDRMGDKVAILEGWGGYYMLEAIPVGCVGIMPGTPIWELLDRVVTARVAGRTVEAFDQFASLLPFINFTLQDFELFLQVEKRLMVRRGLFETAICRELTNTPSDLTLRYIEELLDYIERLYERTDVPFHVG